MNCRRSRLAGQLQVLRQLVMDTDHGLDEVTMDKIRSLDRCGVRTNTNILSPGLTREAMNCRRSAINLTEASVLDVEDQHQHPLPRADQGGHELQEERHQ